MLTYWKQPEQKHQQSRPALPNIQFHLISQLTAIFHTAKEKTGWCDKFSMVPQWSWLTLNLVCLYTNKCNRFFIFSKQVKPDIKKMCYCFIFFQLYPNLLEY